MRLETGWRVMRAIIAAALAAALIACGSSEDGGGTGGTGLGGGGTRSVSVGAVTDTDGGVAVNGTRYATEGATVSVGGETADQEAIKPGMVVRIDGTTDDSESTAQAIFYAADVKGPVETEFEGGFSVLGQTVHVDNLAYIENLAGQTVPVSEISAAVEAGYMVEVSGYRDGDGSVRATRVEVLSAAFAPGMLLELRGTVDEVLSGNAFTLAGLTIKHDGTTTVQAGVEVEVEATEPPSGGTLVALRVEREGAVVAENDVLELEGLVTRVDVAVSAQAGEFLVGRQRVRTDAATRFQYGPPEDVVVNAKVEAEGRIAADGTLVASKVAFRSIVRIEAPGAVSESEIIILGRPVLVSALTDATDLIEGLLALAGIADPLGGDVLGGLLAGTSDLLGEAPEGALTDLSGLLLGDILPLLPPETLVDQFVRVRGYVDRAGNIVATRVELAEPLDGGRVILQGPVSAVNATTSLTILDITVDISGAASFQAQDGTAISAAQFHAAVAAGSVVKAKGTFDAIMGITAEEAELEN